MRKPITPDLERALERLQSGPISWHSLPAGVAQDLIARGLAVQDGIAWLRLPTETTTP